MSYDPRWRLMCGPENESCAFVVSRREASKVSTIRLDCIRHFNAFTATAASKGVLKMERTDSVSEPARKAPSSFDKQGAG